MPHYTSLVTNKEISTEDFLAISYGTLIQLGWKISYATDTTLIGSTPRKWNKWDHQVTIDVTDGEKTITSTSVHGEAMDLPKRNKKHCEEFTAVYSDVAASVTPETVLKWREEVEKLKAGTIASVEKEIKEIEEIDRVMNYSSGKPYITYGLIAINILIFIIMAISGVNVFSPLVSDIINWGGNIAIGTFNGEGWRLFTAMFIHIGVLHLALNMYALFMIGSQLEPMLGKFRFAVVYLCAGLLASLVSVYWNRDELIVSAGASGAIFGMFGVLLALMTTSVIPKRVRNEQMGGILIFVVYNIFYGLRKDSGIDNAAHLGGLAAGMAIGYIIYLDLRVKKRTTSLLITLAILLSTAAGALFALKQNRISEFVYVEESATEKYDEAIEAEFQLSDLRIAEHERLNEMSVTALMISDQHQVPANWYLMTTQDAIRLRDTVLPILETAIKEFSATGSFKVSVHDHEVRNQVEEYLQLQLKRGEMLVAAVLEKSAKHDREIGINVDQVEFVLDRMRQLTEELQKK